MAGMAVFHTSKGHHSATSYILQLNLPPVTEVLYLPTVALLAVLVLLPMARALLRIRWISNEHRLWWSHRAFDQWGYHGVPQFMV